MKTRRKPKRKLNPELTKQITPSRPAKPKVTPQFRARFLAFCASQDLKAFAGTIHNAALAEDKLFFKYLADFLEKKPIRLPISEQQRKLLQLLFQRPHLSAAEALKELPWLSSKEHFRAEKKRALEKSELMQQAWRRGWLDQA
jgi:hypothetical protein